MLAEQVTSAASETVNITGRGWQGQGVPLAAIRALAARDWQATAPAAELAAFEQARANPPVGNDLLMVVNEHGRQTTPCIVDKLQADGPSVVAAGRALSVPWSQVGWLVLSPAAGTAPAEAPAHLVVLADGTALRAASLALEGGKLTAADGPASYSIEPARVARIQLAPLGLRLPQRPEADPDRADALRGRVLAAAHRPVRRRRAARAEGAHLREGHRCLRRHAHDVRPAARLLEVLRPGRGGRRGAAS